MIGRLLKRLRADARGNTIVEFAIVAPVMVVMLMGLCDLLYQAYAQAVLDGSIQKAGRDSAIQGGADQATVIDENVMRMVKTIAADATWTSKREAYSSFGTMKAETFTDSNNNGVYDPKECFSDINGNRIWDANPSRTGQGGANDITLYTVTVTYPRIFPIGQLLGQSTTQIIKSKTLLKNQPYAKQIVLAPVPVCP